MNWDQIEGNWKQLKGKAKANWGDLTDDELNKSKAGVKSWSAWCRKSTARRATPPSARSTSGRTASEAGTPLNTRLTEGQRHDRRCPRCFVAPALSEPFRLSRVMSRGGLK